MLISIERSLVKKLFNVLIPLLLAKSDKFFAGSMPNILFVNFFNEFKKVPSLEPISTIKLLSSIKKFLFKSSEMSSKCLVKVAETDGI